MTGDDRKRPIFTGDDLPDEDPIAPDPVAPRWDDADEDFADFAPAPATGRLGFDDGGEERLPWLESADDIDADEGFDSGRVIGFLMLGLLALGMIVGAVWLATNRGAPGPADGSLIRAEAGPYKVPPTDPGGKTFEGTGNTSYQVAQGEGQPGPGGPASPAPATPSPSVSASPVPTPSAKPAAGPSSSTSAASGVGVQIGAYTSAADAEQGWSKLVSRHTALSGLQHRVVEGQADFGRVFRLQAVTGDTGSANALCAALKAGGQGCQVKK